MPQNRHFDLNLLRSFIAVYQLGSFTQAAEKLDLTQSSVSNSIARLKRALGVNLFVRDGQKMLPTAAAQQLYRQISDQFLSIEQAVSQFEDFDPEMQKRQFKIFASDTIMQMLVHEIEAETEETNIDVVFKESPTTEQEMLEAINLDKVDLLIDICPPSGSVMEYEKIFSDEVAVVARKGHPRIKGSITKEQFFEEKHVLNNVERSATTALETITSEPLSARKAFSEQASIHGALATVNSTNAITTTLLSVANSFGTLLDLQVMPVPLKTKSMDFYMIWHKRYNHNKAHMWLRDLIKSSVSN